MAPASVKRLATSVLPIALALAAAALLFSPALAHGKILAVGDGLVEALPAFLAPNERWEPSMLAGFPIYADPSKAFWYPLRLLRYVPNGFNLYVIAGYAVAAWATYGYVRSVTGVVVAGIASAVAFTCGGFLISHFGHPMLVQPAAWAVAAVWSLDSYVRSGATRWLIGIVVTEVLCLLSGQPQIAAFTIPLLLSYLLWNGCSSSLGKTLRVYSEGIGAIVLGVAAAGIAWIPTVAQGAASVRSGLDFRSFVVDSLPLHHLARMLVFPFAASGGASAIYHGAFMVPTEGATFTETACYVPLGALALVSLAPFAGRIRLVLYWLGIACVALMLAAGDALPLAALTFELPGFNLFRIPGRHAFEFTLAIAVLAGFGVAAIARGVQRRAVLYGALLAIFVVAGLATIDISYWDAGFTHDPAFTIFLFALVLQAALLLATTATRSSQLAAAMACGAVVAGSLAFGTTAYWLDATPATVLAKPAYVALLERLPLGRGQRVYTRGDDSLKQLQPNLPSIWGVPDAGGETPLQFSTARIFLQNGGNGRFLDVASPLIDAAAVRYHAVPARREGGVGLGVRYAESNLGDFLSVGRAEAPHSLRFGLEHPHRADRIALVTALGAAIDVQQGTTVAIVTLRAISGATQLLPLRAGVETAEFAYDRPDVFTTVRHRQPRAYWRDGYNSWYECLLPVRLREPVASVEIRMIAPHAALNVRNISLIDQRAARAYTFSDEAPYFGDPRHFRHVADVDGVALFENLRSSPAVWVARALPRTLDTSSDVDLAAYRERLRGLDLRHDALTDGVAPMGPVSGDARLVRDAPERRDVVATCRTRCLLVSSMTFTNDWTVAVNGAPSSLVRADGFLQGVALPPGRNIVEFRYRPVAGRDGVLLSGISLTVLLTWILLRPRFRRRKSIPPPDAPFTGC